MKKPKINNSNTCDFLVVGTGNISLKHSINIKEIYKNKTIAILKRSNSKFNKRLKSISNYFIKDFDDISPKTSKSIAIIASPATFHIDDALKLAKKGFNLLIEKPISTDKSKVKTLQKICNQKKLKSLVGYNIRFLESLVKLKNIIKRKIYGEIFHVHIYVGSNFKSWRNPNSYLQTVTVKKEFGGGVLNELSHEIDYMIYLFGLPDSVIVNAIRNKKGKLDVESNITAIFKYNKKKFNVTMHLNFLSDNVSRYCLTEFNSASLKINIFKNTMITSGHNKKMRIETFENSLENTYKAELKYLTNCIKKNIQVSPGIKEGLDALITINAMKDSITKRREINING